MCQHALVPRLVWLVSFLTALSGSHLGAAIFRWDTGAVVPGTEEIEPGPGVDLSQRSLEYADLSSLDLKGADLSFSDLSFARFNGAILNEADFTGSMIRGARFDDTFSRGFTKEQLYSTASYQQRDLRQIGLTDPTGNSVLNGWDFTGQDLTGAAFTDCFAEEGCYGTTMIGINLSDANLSNANLLVSFGLESAVVNSGTEYNQGTLLPLFFDPISAGLTMVPSAVGDLDANGTLEAIDIDWLSDRIRGEEPPVWWLPDPMFDLNQDSVIDSQDHHAWVKERKQTWVGDTNLDGEFDTADIVAILTAGKYETKIRCGWAEGDWNGDAFFNTTDLVMALMDGGYEQGPWSPIAAVPEPSAFWLLAIGLLVTTHSRRI